MSLLNQVLQDLETRQRPTAQMSIRLAAAPCAANDWHEGGWYERLRPGLISMLVATLLVLTAWAFQLSWEKPHAAVAPGAVERAMSPVATLVVESNGGNPPVHASETPAQVSDSGGVDLTPSPQTAAIAFAPPGEPAVSTELLPPGEVVDSSIDRQEVVAEEIDTVESPPATIAPPQFLPLRNVELPIESVRPARTKAKREISVHQRVRDSMDAARDAISSGELATAENILSRRLRGRPADRDARELLVGLLLRGDRSDEALRQLETGLAYHPAHGKFLLIVAQLQAVKGDSEAAIATLRRGAGIRSIRSQSLQMLGALQQQNGQYAAASESYRQLVTLEPRLAKAWMGLALSLDAEGEPGAASLYRRALDIGGLGEAAAGYARQRLVALE